MPINQIFCAFHSSFYKDALARSSCSSHTDSACHRHHVCGYSRLTREAVIFEFSRRHEKCTAHSHSTYSNLWYPYSEWGSVNSRNVLIRRFSDFAHSSIAIASTVGVLEQISVQEWYPMLQKCRYLYMIHFLEYPTRYAWRTKYFVGPRTASFARCASRYRDDIVGIAITVE